VTPFVTEILYNARRQRESITYGSGVHTNYAYDPLTYRLVSLSTQHGGESDPLQDLHYTYDPMGNVSAIRDYAQQTIFFNNQRIEPHAQYVYDAVYRLIEASGREHLGQIGGVANPPAPTAYNDDLIRANLPHPGDGNAMGAYRETYRYDQVGNILALVHRGTDPAQPGWTRTYTYTTPGLINPSQPNNQLTSSGIGGLTVSYLHDVHGNMTQMPHLSQMDWNERDQLHMLDLGGGGRVYYVYDAAGQRVRKVWEKSPGLTEERIYVGIFEVFRRRDGTGSITVERESLHIMDGQQRIALVETRTQGSDASPAQLIRYQHANHLGSSALELDQIARVISYEEYYPFGGTAYQALNSVIQAAAKRYRYTGKEHDDESGLYYHGARYCAPWLGRWISFDPVAWKPGAAGSPGGGSPFVYASNSPINRVDSNGMQDRPADDVPTEPETQDDHAETQTPPETSPSPSPDFALRFVGVDMFGRFSLSRDSAEREPDGGLRLNASGTIRLDAYDPSALRGLEVDGRIVTDQLSFLPRDLEFRIQFNYTGTEYGSTATPSGDRPSDPLLFQRDISGMAWMSALGLPFPMPFWFHESRSGDTSQGQYINPLVSMGRWTFHPETGVHAEGLVWPIVNLTVRGMLPSVQDVTSRGEPLSDWYGRSVYEPGIGLGLSYYHVTPSTLVYLGLGYAPSSSYTNFGDMSLLPGIGDMRFPAPFLPDSVGQPRIRELPGIRELNIPAPNPDLGGYFGFYMFGRFDIQNIFGR
jgi:RHS repeat-associated protein